MIAGHSKKDIVLNALHQNGMAPDVRTLVVWTKGIDHGMNIKTMTRVLWDMQKQQLVGFAERHGELFKIRMTDVAAATLYGREKRKKQPVERVVEARKPVIIPTPEYRVPEPPRYAAPAPPAQNIKEDVVVDTHTQYRYNPTDQHNLYPHRPNTRSGQVSMRSAARMLVGLDQLGGQGSPKEAAMAVGINTNSRPSVFTQVLEHWGWVERVERSVIKITPDGYKALADYRIDEDPENWILSPDKKTAIRKPAPLPVVARDEADAEKPLRAEEPTDQIERERAEAVETLQINLDDYPLIKDLMGKEARLARYERAAAILAEDEDDTTTSGIVLELLDKIQITDLEREVIRYVRSTQL